MPNTRKLTPAEEKRKAAFESLSRKMQEDGYARTDLTLGVVKANVLAIAAMLPFALLSFAVFAVASPGGSLAFSLPEYVFLLVGIAVFSVLHEGIHGLTWGFFAKNRFKSIEFGVIWKMLTPYCTCSEPLKKWQYVLGSAMPTLVLGIGLTAAAAALGSKAAEFLAVVFIFGGGADFIIILKILAHRSKGRDVVFYDHPYECGVVAFEKTERRKNISEEQ